ncbi:hypothetical protein MPH_05648 [Macrophomina phaseolina MS6]|uniref:F-box domain-containing protein n=1 Tax=Macrophomina phaseolina (strain MS6) TaxID=1126212 RepID=K2S3Q7_MACPH|nr:hypothetical protein MPH_05648 [Macrophomina phaseolina MS6]
MAPADQLPDELLFEILGYIDTARRRGDYEGAWGSHERVKGNPKNPVLRFCLVSKRFLRVGEPVLYSFFSNGMDENAQPHTSRRQYLHRIIERPDLAARVSEIHFEVMEGDMGSVTRPRRTMYGIVGYGDERSDEDSDTASEQNHHRDAREMMLDDSDEEEDQNAIQNLNSRADRIAFVTAAHQVEMQNKSAWLEDLRAGNPYAELVLLLCQCLNLTKLLLRVPDKSGYDFNYRNLRMLLGQVEKNNTAGNANGPLRNLRTLEIEYAADKVDSVFALGFPAQYMQDFFTIPSLRELKGYMISTRSRYTEGFETDSEMDPDDLDGPQPTHLHLAKPHLPHPIPHPDVRQHHRRNSPHAPHRLRQPHPPPPLLVLRRPNLHQP